MQGASRESLVRARAALTELSAGTAGSGGVGPVADGLFPVVRLLDREGTLRRTLGDPMTPPEAKRSLLDALMSAQLQPLPLRVLQGLVVQRWSSPRDLVDAIEVLAVQAAFLVAEADGSLDDVEDDLFRFSRIVGHDPALRAALTDRALPDDNKRALLTALLGGKVRPTTLQVVEQVVLSPRGRTLEDGLADYAGYAADVRTRTLARVTSAVPLDAGQQDRLSAALTRTLGREVQVLVEVDPQVVGGLVVLVGAEVIDASVARRLEDVRRRFAA